MMTAMHIFTTTAGGDGPEDECLCRQMCRFEQTPGYILFGQMPLQLWYWATKQAARMYRLKALGGSLPAADPAC